MHLSVLFILSLAVKTKKVNRAGLRIEWNTLPRENFFLALSSEGNLLFVVLCKRF